MDVSNQSLVFATGNVRKIAEATNVLSRYHITLTPQAFEIDEIQHHDPAEITKAKARAAYAAAGMPVVVSDTSWDIPALGGFPGGYMKDVAAWWQPDDWMNVIKAHDRTITCLEHVAYYDGATLMHFEAQYPGVFVDTPAGGYGNSIEKVVCLYGGKTLAEMHDEQGIASAGEELAHWHQFGQWYAARQR